MRLEDTAEVLSVGHAYLRTHIVHGGFCPYPVTVGETPLILVVYRPCNIPPHADDLIEA